MVDIYKEIGRRVQEAREGAGLSQEELASLVGVTQSALSNYELGKRRLYLANLERIARALKRPIGYFFEETVGAFFEETVGTTAISKQEETSDETTSEIIELLSELPEHEKKYLLEYIRWRRYRLG